MLKIIRKVDSFLKETPRTNLERHLNPHSGHLLALVVSLGAIITPIKPQVVAFLEIHRLLKTLVQLLVVFLVVPMPQTKQVLQAAAFLDPATILPTTILAKAHFSARNLQLQRAACLEAILALPTIHLPVGSLVEVATLMPAPAVACLETQTHCQLPKLEAYLVETTKLPGVFSVDPTRTQEVCLEITTILIKAQVVSLAGPPTTHSTTPTILSSRNSQP